MRLSLVDNLVMPDARDLDMLDVHPHLGLLSIAAVAIQDGHDVGIYDPKRQVRLGHLGYDRDLYRNVADELLAARPDAIGFTTMGCSFVFVLNVAELLKEREPELPVLLGGPHATMLHREILERFPQIDVIVRHEAEGTLPRVLRNLERRDFVGIPAVSWRRGRRGGTAETPGLPLIEDLDTLPLLPYDLYPVEELDLDMLRIEAGRGCPYACTFCSTASFFQRSFRLKSPARLVKELDRLSARYGVTEFKLDHDMFTVSRRKVLAFCEAVKGRGYQWRVSARVDRVDAEMVEKMSEAGCIGLYFGIETGSQEMQKIASKGLKLDDVQAKLAICEELGIQTTVSFITGFPDEEASHQDDTLDMLGRTFCRPGSSSIPQLHILAPEPGTPLFEEYGAVMEFDGYASTFNAALLGDHDEELVVEHPGIFPTYFYYPARLPRLHYTFAVDAFDVLRRVGGTVLGYSLCFYGGKLSELCAKLRAWAIDQDRLDCIEPQLVIDFLVDEFGAHHHLVSLFRYSFCAYSNPRPGTVSFSRPTESAPLDLDQIYQLDPRAFLFRNLHECGTLIERINARLDRTEVLDDAATGDRGCYLVMTRNGLVENYAIDPGVHVILSTFETPRCCGEVVEAVAEISDGASIAPGFFENLIRIGVLVGSDGEAAAFPAPARSASARAYG